MICETPGCINRPKWRHLYFFEKEGSWFAKNVQITVNQRDLCEECSLQLKVDKVNIDQNLIPNERTTTNNPNR